MPDHKDVGDNFAGFNKKVSFIRVHPGNTYLTHPCVRDSGILLGSTRRVLPALMTRLALSGSIRETLISHIPVFGNQHII